ncbi:phage tail assembly chaperone [Rhizobium sp. XQZ8]|uniref:rcc01693 family protein n=1 Tax=Rhizobium populisoli TaxID=2859785 RepID=UPI001C679356|nr:rcc01693 family protein [Rhizobium populisoli]MBW6421266.1 phage tail assembly chaperone [Rhizobium populisoli]
MRAAAGETADHHEPFPWDTALHVGLHLLRLSIRDFWALTPREFNAATGGLKPRPSGLERVGLEALMRAFPDGGVRLPHADRSPIAT